MKSRSAYFKLLLILSNFDFLTCKLMVTVTELNSTVSFALCRDAGGNIKLELW